MTELADALARLAATPRLLVALDFDGTLSPLVDAPEDARALPEAQQAILSLLEAPETRVALISGRALRSLIAVSQVPDSVLLSGSHGIEARLDSEPGLTLTPREIADVELLHQILARVAESYENVWLESKPAGLALHSRLAAPADAEAAQQAARREALAALPRLTVRRGSDVLEFSVRSTTKGDAIRLLREFAGASAVFFAGDDVTDEDGFAALQPGDVGVKCGAGATAASFSVSGPHQVAEVLKDLANMRKREFSS